VFQPTIKLVTLSPNRVIRTKVSLAIVESSLISFPTSVDGLIVAVNDYQLNTTEEAEEWKSWKSFIQFPMKKI